MTMKLYVWENVLTDYTDGIMFAIAPSVKEAREELLKQCNTKMVKDDLKKQPLEFDMTEKAAFIILGGS